MNERERERERLDFYVLLLQKSIKDKQFNTTKQGIIYKSGKKRKRRKQFNFQVIDKSLITVYTHGYPQKKNTLEKGEEDDKKRESKHRLHTYRRD